MHPIIRSCSTPLPSPRSWNLFRYQFTKSPSQHLVEQTTIGMGEPMMLVSPITTVSVANPSKRCNNCTVTSRSFESLLRSQSGKQDRLTQEFFKEDENNWTKCRSFDPCLHGVGLHYRLIRGDDSHIAKLSAHSGIKQKQHFVHRNCFAFGGIGRRVLCRNVRTSVCTLVSAAFTAQRMNYCTSF
jgi:hypothetical protein